MKKYLIFVLIVSVLAGCAKKTDKLFDAGSMSATVGGNSFATSSCYENVVLNITQDFIIKGTGTDGHSFIVLRLRGSKIVPGDYNVDGTNGAQYITNNATYDGINGTITVAYDSAGVATGGSFDFNTLQTGNVTGSFRAVFLKENL